MERENAINRESNMELLRVLSMAAIILNHAVSLGEVLDGVTFNGNTLISLFFLLGGKFGTNVFVIIGLYFLVDKQRFDSQKIARLWMQTLFYSVMLNLFDVIVFSGKIPWKVWVKSFLPIIGRSYWFASSYIILLLLLPVLNRFYEKWNIRIGHIVAGTFIFSILPTVTLNGALLGDSYFIRVVFKLLMFGPVWFSFLYMGVRYFKPILKKMRGGVEALVAVLLFTVSYFLMFLIEAVMYKKGIHGNVFMKNNYSTIRDMSSFPCLTAAIAIFLLFVNLHIRKNRIINRLASNTFGIYLLHTHETIAPVFWRGIFSLSFVVKTRWYVQYCIILVAGIFAVGCVIEYLRKKLERFIFKLLQRRSLFERIDAAVNARFYEV